MSIFEEVAIVGPGMIGASIGLGMRGQGLAARVVGIGRRQASIDKAVAVGAVDVGTLEMQEGVAQADLVVLATPIGALGDAARRAAAAMKPGATITDVASTKCRVIEAVQAALSERADVTYIPTHPMAGSEKRGPEAANAAIFQGSVCIFTPLPGTPSAALERLKALWEALGATVVVMEPAEHDRVVARISHLPHLAAAALVHAAGEEDARCCGSGFTDTTRVASGDAALWREICETNRQQIDSALKDYIDTLERLRALIRERRFEELQGLLAEAKAKRDRLLGRDRG